MSLFQNSVLNKYLKETNQTEMRSAYEKLIAYFHNPVIQQNIRESKEEEYQDGFLNALFVNVLGYTIKPNPDYNLTREFKNEKGAKKADGAILKDGAAIGVIELKSTTTKDLESIRLQAFDYKANQSKCVYVITSNFEKIRFYINNAVDFEEFELFKLKYEQFQLLWLCLAKENLLKGIPLAIKEDSVIKEANVTKKIYLDYTAFKHDLYNNLIENNLDLEIFNGNDEKEIKLLLFKKSQKLIDRFLFIFFGEDRGLLPPNSISEIVKQWENQSDWGDDIHLYDRYKKYFHLLNTGWKGKKYEIFAYNGGLFAPDEVLDNVKIGDEILKKHTEVLTGYDFETEVDVNILGHIFENSLNEIEEIAAHIEGVEVDLKKSKRKKDGVFYTPKYITKYIVENTVGKLCSEKKTVLGILDFDYDKDFKLKTWRTIETVVEAKVKNEVRKVVEKRKTNISVEGTNQLEILNNYRNWLLNLTICDPACGSGAFLNQALDFLIGEHNTITEFTQKITGDVSSMFIDIENQILEKNIYGVDINEESVEIAKLSLWLRTAQKGRKLTTLSNNIKCGNSLIDDIEVAGEKAFNWQNEFPEVFKKGGFDVVIGNPPYVNIVNIGDEKYRKVLQKVFKTFKNKCDLYSLFIEKGILLTKSKGELGFIFPNSWMGTSSFSVFREYISKETEIGSLVELPPGVFQDAVVTTVIMTMKKKAPSSNHKIQLLYPENQIFRNRTYSINLFEILSSSHYAYSFQPKFDLRSKGKKLGDIVSFSLGIKTSNDERFMFDYKKDIDTFPILRGKNIGRYYLNYGGEYIWYKPELIKEKSGGRPRILDHFLRPKILIQDIAKSINAVYDESKYLVNDTVNFIYETHEGISLHYILGLLNSRAVNLWFSSTFPEGLHIKINQLQEIPIPESTDNQRLVISELVTKALAKHNEIRDMIYKFSKYLCSNFHIENLNMKLKNWNVLEFGEFINELQRTINGSGKKISKMDEMEWMDVFEIKKSEVQTLKSEIDKTDREIDRMVYELYGLTDDEIGIVEESTK
jgi:hypothetical protein